MPAVRPIQRGRSGGYAENALSLLSKHWDALSYVHINRSNGVQQVSIDREIGKEPTDGPTDMLEAILREIAVNAQENGPAYYKVDMIGLRPAKKGDSEGIEGPLGDFILPGGDADAAPGTVKTEAIGLLGEQRKFLGEMTKSLKEIVGVVAEREKTSLDVLQQAAAVIKSGAESQAVLVDLAKVRMEDARDLRDRDDKRAERDADNERLQMGVALAQSVLTPLLPGLLAYVQAKAAEAKANADNAAGSEGAEPEETVRQDGEPRREGADEVGGGKVREGESPAGGAGGTSSPVDPAVTPSPPPAEPRSSASVDPVDPGPDKPRPKKKPPKPLSPLAMQTAMLLKEITLDERERLVAATGEDVWSCVEAAAEQAETAATIAVFKKMKELRKDMTAEARLVMTNELQDVLGPVRSMTFAMILVQAGVEKMPGMPTSAGKRRGGK